MKILVCQDNWDQIIISDQALELVRQAFAVELLKLKFEDSEKTLRVLVNDREGRKLSFRCSVVLSTGEDSVMDDSPARDIEGLVILPIPEWVGLCYGGCPLQKTLFTISEAKEAARKFVSQLP